MCGIAGCYQQPDGHKLADIMTDRIAHRGPDSTGIWSHEDAAVHVQLGFRRLSIIDLSAAADQPMHCDRLSIVFNGELYNYRELRAELVSAGVSFRTQSDTEVVVESWRRWGPAALPRFRGMFAFALFDHATGELALVRDPFGIKPLYYRHRGNGVVFASELKALLGVLGTELQMDPKALVASMLFYWVPDQLCAVRSVEKLQPGTWAEFRPDGTHHVECYWDIVEQAAAAQETSYDLRTVIEESVAAHLVADVPVSSFLSGGLDSSIVTVLAKRMNPRIDAYTIRFRGQDQRLEAMPDDATYARKVAQAHGIALHEIELQPDVVGLLPRMVDILDEPTGDPAAINTLLMSQAARAAGVKVLLSGMGADELFGGYRKHFACLLAGRYRRLPTFVRRSAGGVIERMPVTVGSRGLRYARWAKRFTSFAQLPEEAAFRRSYSLYSPSELAALLSPELRADVEDVVDQHRRVYEDNTLPDQVNRMCLTDTRLFLPGLNLAYTDRASMAASTAVRVPFVDPAVFRAAFSLTGRQKIAGKSGKVALKKAAEAWLPKEIVHRPKASFSAPLRAWVANDLRDVVNDELLGGDLVKTEFLSRRGVATLVEEHRSGREDRSKQIWQLLTLEFWYRQARRAGVGT
jgi:asparagine synthase (glutamine-hydrolysing)